MYHRFICHSDAFQEHAHVANEMSVFEFMEYSIFHKTIILMFQLTQDPFMCILFQILQN